MYAFIVNPNARTGLGIKIWETLEPVLKERNIEYSACLTRYPEHATEYARSLSNTQEELTLVILGGDGTLNEAVNGICDFSKITLGFIPIGSSNDFARSMGLPEDPMSALEQILHPSRFTYINIGKLSFGDNIRRFAVSSGIGFDADVCFHNTSSKIKKSLNKLKLGKLSYTGVALCLLLALKPKPVTISLDGHVQSFRKTLFATAMNQRYEGGGFKFCPDADPGDDILNIIVAADIPKLKALILLPTAFKGWHVRFKGIHTYTCRTARIISDAALPVHTDGEPVLRGREIAFSLEPEKLRFIQG